MNKKIILLCSLNFYLHSLTRQIWKDVLFQFLHCLTLKKCFCKILGVLKKFEEEDLDDLLRKRLKDSSELPGALWHIYAGKDADKIREFLQKVRFTVDVYKI